MILYQGNSFVIYYDTNSWNFTRLGKVDGVSSRNEMLDLLGGKGEVTVTLSLAE
ncbi:cyclophilin-like fold protein [Phocaeicola plebeius]|uniref:cyclophilin-like fold protein n=1 Tax=Phocaeicola plebeius TaxID=310297 RepID=UPI0034E989F7